MTPYSTLYVFSNSARGTQNYIDHWILNFPWTDISRYPKICRYSRYRVDTRHREMQVTKLKGVPSCRGHAAVPTCHYIIVMLFSEWSQEFNNYNWKKYHSSWKPDTGYRSDALIGHLPLRTFGDGDYHSATMKLELHSEDMNKQCAQGLDVFYILIHSPAEWPDRSHPTLLASVNMISTISIKPYVVTTAEELIPWDPQIRHCYFQNERKLKFFKVYTKNNCILECRSFNILAQCGCVPFYYLRTKNTPVCGPAKMPCWVTASQTSSDACDCLPGCTEFFFKTSTMNAQLTESVKKENETDLAPSSVILSVYYQSKNFIGHNRIMTFTFGQFMGNVGGIMGLCLGFSFLSLVEIIYFLTLRPLVNFCNAKRKLKKVDPTRVLGEEPI
ncbi:pickpocket protein 28-like isoform X1 [Myzus persicae]|uniref:pickpocket protein 28-like isoform X1 n=1 Tax=Myzus persicae TaxID=13164 RepID=UPI000B931506|nr:pickpocket protein 28-like isoform X1 [Myzus persicae]